MLISVSYLISGPGENPQNRIGFRVMLCARSAGARRPSRGGGAIVSYQVNAASVEWNPTTERLRELTEKMPNCQVTEFGNVAVKARVDSRSTRSTYLVEDSTNSRKQTTPREEYDRIAAAQDAYIAGCHMVVVDGYIGPDPGFRTRARLVMEAANA